MPTRHHIAIVSGIATLLTSTVLFSVFDGGAWLPPVALGIAVIVAAMIGVRATRLPAWTHAPAGVLATLIFVTALFGRRTGLLGIIPTPATFVALRDEIASGFRDISELAAPVPARPGLVLLTVLGMAVVTILVDTVSVTLRRAALAGLPLLAVYAVAVSIDRQGVPWIPFVLGAAGYLWLLAAEHIETVRRWGRPFRASAPAPHLAAADVGGPMGAAGRRVGLVGVALAVLIPLAVPGLTSEGWLGLLGSGDIGPGAGRSIETVNPITQLRGQLNLDNPVELLRVRTNDPGPYYLRLTTLDRFTGAGWTQGSLSARPSDRVSRNDPVVPPLSDFVLTKRQRTRVEVKGLTGSPYLPVYANPRNVDVDGDWRWDRDSESIFSTQKKTRGLTYTFDSTKVLYTPEILAAAPAPNDPQLVRRYTALRGEEAFVRRIVDGLVNDKTTQYDRVVAINQYFDPSNGFRYDLRTRQGTSDSALVNFLQQKVGYCEQYASAMAYMVRAAGIPARVAVGFGYGTAQNGYRVISTRDAHAWVEVYFSGVGWVPFDPTPPSGTDGRTGNLSWTVPPSTEESETGPESSAAPSTGPQASAAPAPGASERDPDAGLDLSDSSKEQTGLAAVPTIVWWAAGLVLVLIALSVPAVVRWRMRRRRLDVAARAGPVQAAHTAWDEILDSMLDVGLAPDDAETPRSVASRLSGEGFNEPARSAVALLGRAEEEARYAPEARGVGPLAEAVTSTRDALLATSSRGARLKARWFPASVLLAGSARGRRWSEVTSSWFARVRRALTPSRFRR